MSNPTPQPATVLFVQYGRDWIRGSERCLLDLMGNLSRERFRPVLWCNATALADAARAAGVEVHHAPTMPEEGGHSR